MAGFGRLIAERTHFNEQLLAIEKALTHEDYGRERF
jgi:hypothetical protein